MLFPRAPAKSKVAKRVGISFKESHYTARLPKWHCTIFRHNCHCDKVQEEGWAGCSPDLDGCPWWLDAGRSSKLHHTVEYLCSSTRMQDVVPAPNAAACQIKPLRLWADLGVKGEHYRLSHPASHMSGLSTSCR